MKMDPRFGTFKVLVNEYRVDDGIWVPMTPIDVGTKEVDMKTDETARKILYYYADEPFGVYSAQDFSKLLLMGELNDAP